MQTLDYNSCCLLNTLVYLLMSSLIRGIPSNYICIIFVSMFVPVVYPILLNTTVIKSKIELILLLKKYE